MLVTMAITSYTSNLLLAGLIGIVVGAILYHCFKQPAFKRLKRLEKIYAKTTF